MEKSLGLITLVALTALTGCSGADEEKAAAEQRAAAESVAVAALTDPGEGLCEGTQKSNPLKDIEVKSARLEANAQTWHITYSARFFGSEVGGSVTVAPEGCVSHISVDTGYEY